MIRKLRRKFICSAMLAILLVLGVIVGTIHIVNYHRIAENADALLSILAENGGKFPKLSNPPPDGWKGDGGRKISPETPFELRYFTVELDQDGNVIATDTGNIAAIGEESAIEFAQEVYSSGNEHGFLKFYRYLRQDTQDGCVLLFVDCTRELSNFQGFLTISILMALVGLASVFLLVLAFSKIIFKPVEESYQKQRRFITDAGHELKTPLTIIDADVEVLEMESGESEWTRSIRNQVERLSGLTADLVTLSRMEEGSQITRVDFSLSDAVQETAEEFLPVAQTQEKTFSIEVEPGLTYCGDERSLRRLVSLLLDNAVKYSGEQGKIWVGLQKQGRNLRLTVKNTAENIAEGDLSRLFERFYRGDASRNSQTGGHGIGLSVAKAITEAHKGKISAYGSEGTLTVTVIL